MAVCSLLPVLGGDTVPWTLGFREYVFLQLQMNN